MAYGIIKSTIKAGLIAYENPEDYDARATLMIASSYSHNGLTGLGGNFYFTVHKLEHELSGTYDEIAHGAGLATLYSGWALTVYEKLPHKFARFAKEVMEVENNNELEAAKEGILKLRDFFKEIGMPTTFSDFNISKEEYIEMANRITKNNTVLVPGFVKLDLEIVLSIFEKIK